MTRIFHSTTNHRGDPYATKSDGQIAIQTPNTLPKGATLTVWATFAGTAKNFSVLTRSPGVTVHDLPAGTIIEVETWGVETGNTQEMQVFASNVIDFVPYEPQQAAIATVSEPKPKAKARTKAKTKKEGAS